MFTIKLNNKKTKKCTCCGTVKKLIEFHKSKETLDGYNRRCSNCVNNRINVSESRMNANNKARFQNRLDVVHKGNIKVLNNYKNQAVKTGFKCINGHVWYAFPPSVLKGLGCKICSGLKHDTKTIGDRILKIHGDKVVMVGSYKNLNVKTTFVCNNGHKWQVTPKSVLSGCGCRVCFNNNNVKGKDEYNKQVAAKYGANVYLVGEYVNRKTPSKHKCSCGNTWIVKPVNFLRRGA